MNIIIDLVMFLFGLLAGFLMQWFLYILCDADNCISKSKRDVNNKQISSEQKDKENQKILAKR